MAGLLFDFGQLKENLRNCVEVFSAHLYYILVIKE